MKKIFFNLIFLSLLGSYVSCISFGPSKPPLYQAVLDNNFNKVKQLVESGVDINAGAYGYTPLECAASEGNLEIIEYLLSKGAQNPHKAFERAMARNHSNVSKYFINAGYVEVNDTARYYSSYFRNESVPFEQRMQNVRDIAGVKLNSPYLLELVKPEHYKSVVDFFKINIRDKADALGNSILHVAAMRNNVDLVKYLLSNNINVNALNNNNHTALFYCITSFGPTIDWYNPIIENETTAKINYISDMPFYGSAANNIRMRQAEIGLLLLNAGINVNQQNSYGWTALHFACASYPAGPQSTLIEKGANQNLKTKFGRTAADLLALRHF
ncbi:MAG: ankyrin repeat domain-containing protein [Treponema sp.]|nr:ankyrin repeat domain-containing protein [Treponema sp.]